jgi:hypothetical protein
MFLFIFSWHDIHCWALFLEGHGGINIPEALRQAFMDWRIDERWTSEYPLLTPVYMTPCKHDIDDCDCDCSPNPIEPLPDPQTPTQNAQTQPTPA